MIWSEPFAIFLPKRSRANGRWLASNGDDGNLYLRPINAPDWTVVRTANVPLLSLETSAAGHLAVVRISHTLYVWQPYPAPARFLWGAVFIGQQPIAFDASGTILAGPSELVDEHLVYLVENKQGGVDLLRRGEFEQLLASFR